MRSYGCYTDTRKKVISFLLFIMFVLIVAGALYMRMNMNAEARAEVTDSPEWVAANAGIEYVKANEEMLFAYIEEDIDSQLELKKSDRAHKVTLEDEVLYGYQDPNGNFIINQSISDESLEFKGSPVQIVCNLKHSISFVPAVDGNTPDDGRYFVETHVGVSSTGRIVNHLAFNDMPDNEEILFYETTRSLSRTYQGDPADYSALDLLMIGRDPVAADGEEQVNEGALEL